MSKRRHINEEFKQLEFPICKKKRIFKVEYKARRVLSLHEIYALQSGEEIAEDTGTNIEDEAAAVEDLQAISKNINQGFVSKKTSAQKRRLTILQKKLQHLEQLETEKKLAFEQRKPTASIADGKIPCIAWVQGESKTCESTQHLPTGNQEYDRKCNGYLSRCKEACESACAKIGLVSMLVDHKAHIQQLFDTVFAAMPVLPLPGASLQEQYFFDRLQQMIGAEKRVTAWSLLDDMWMCLYACMHVPEPLFLEWIDAVEFTLGSLQKCNEIFDLAYEKIMTRAHQVYQSDTKKHELLEKALARILFTMSN